MRLQMTDADGAGTVCHQLGCLDRGAVCAMPSVRALRGVLGQLLLDFAQDAEELCEQPMPTAENVCVNAIDSRGRVARLREVTSSRTHVHDAAFLFSAARRECGM